MKILVINAGSSSIKFQLFEMPTQKVICTGLVDRIGQENGVLKFKTDHSNIQKELFVQDHIAGFNLFIEELLNGKHQIINHKSEIEAIGHRVVHGGNYYSETTIINEEVKSKISELASLAPQHNPANYQGIVIAEAIFTGATQVAVFDTAFHQTMPKEAYTYAIPKKYAENHHVRKYGFHGTSHQYVSQKARDYLGKKYSEKIITLHLGNGCSMTAIKNGKSADHSMGFGPLSGLVMGTRCGDLDPQIIKYLVDQLGISLEEVFRQLNRESGMKGLTGYSDYRDIEQAAEKGNQDCISALNIAAARVKQYLGGFIAKLNGVDALVFTGGVGENSSYFRALICEKMNYLGIEIDPAKNDVKSKGVQEIHSENSRVKLLVIPTNEELEIASQTYKLMNSKAET